jgi:hypothetical protein
LSAIRKLVTALGMVAMGVVVRCGDHDDDEDYREERRITISASAPAEDAATPVGPSDRGHGFLELRAKRAHGSRGDTNGPILAVDTSSREHAAPVL